MKKLFLLLFIFIASLANAQQNVIPLYDGIAPGSETWTWQQQDTTWGENEIIYNVAHPSLTVYPVAESKSTGTAVIIAPGGAMHFLAIGYEGTDVAKWLNKQGITAFVLKYRLVHTNDVIKEVQEATTNENYDSLTANVTQLAQMDGLTAVEYVRQHATDYNLEPDQIGFMGFSAGGTVTMSVVYNANDSNRPNFIAPIYAHVPESFNPTIPETKTPAFIAVASDDGFDLAPTSIEIYNQWLKAEQPAELHVYQKGGHGFGMKKQDLPTDNWTIRFSEWLQVNGYL